MPVRARKTQTHSRKGRARWALYGAGVLILVFIWTRMSRWGTKSNTPSSKSKIRTTLDVYKGIELVWAVPENDSLKAKGIVFLAHGCGHSARDWREDGLPVEKRIVQEVLSKGLIAFAVSGTGRFKCWRLPPEETDVERIKTGLARLFERLGSHLERLPLFAIGCSSGGYLVALLPKYVRLAGVGIIAASARNDVLQSKFVGQKQYPPSAFVYFKKDSRTASLVKENIKVLKMLKVPVVDFLVFSKPLTRSFFSDNIATLPVQTSVNIHEAFLRHSIIDRDGWLKQDPRRSSWRTALNGIENLGSDTLQPDKSPISEIMNVAWGQHELTAEFISKMLRFLISHADR